jgi:ribonucleotide monophosphatase NagD (HAD superfamily)
MPGLLAKRYCDKGQEAKIHQVGKPFPAVFEECFKIIRNKRRDNSLPPISLDRICMIGDSIEHDVLGANNMGIDCVFIQAGVHSNELQISEASPIPPSEQVFEDFLKRHSKATPTDIIPCFTFNYLIAYMGGAEGNDPC